jgi:hypothetical protein
MYPTCMRPLALMAIDAASTGGVTALAEASECSWNPNGPDTREWVAHNTTSRSKFSQYLPTTMIVVYTRETVTR